MKRRWVWTPEGMVEVAADYAPRPRVHIVSDGHAPFRSMATGRMHDSKSAYRAELRARGFAELGNEFSAVTERPDCRPQGVAEDLRRSAAELGMAG